MNSLLGILHDLIDGTTHGETVKNDLHQAVTDLGEVGAAVPASSPDTPEPASSPEPAAEPAENGPGGF